MNAADRSEDGPMNEDATGSIRVLLFGQAAELAGWSERSFPCLGTVAELRHRLVDDGGPLTAMGGSLAVAVNQRLAAESTPLSPGDEVAFLPPVSGG